MSKVIIHVTLPLDGLLAGPNDEILIHLVPIFLGEGIRLFDHLNTRPIELERTEII